MISEVKENERKNYWHLCYSYSQQVYWQDVQQDKTEEIQNRGNSERGDFPQEETEIKAASSGQ